MTSTSFSHPLPAHDAPPAATVRGLSKTYGHGDTTVHALRSVDLDLAPGRFTAIMGPSGSGKSTLMHCLAGLDRPTEGTVAIGGVELTSLGDDQLTHFRRDRLGFVFQAFNLLPMLTARQNIMLPFELAGRRLELGATERIEQVIDVLGLRDRLDHRPGELSGGQQQRVAIARALAADADVVFADEPTGNLDSTASGEVLSFLRRSVTDLGHTVIMVTHELDAAAYADDVVVLADGRIREHLVAPSREQVAATLEAGVR
ncbi:ABC transporter ATP-binding protein [Aeromicrobium duanguangcaii]|uniref:ABC transporter ATP-binding protein n=1 Tax=Aeromicrobium duanguangcaii TaxID=2968086 RepID=UPI002016DCD0|nr:ABC transporter ATP-binding protein [Aeromicrobium duanguangcaii]MCL3838421.1 ABC transporter ATP-binding protein [Aeromicrobium duanguangcaii]